MERLEYVGGTSRKFWEGARDGLSVTVRWGRIGTSGQSKTKEFASEQSARDHLAKLIAEKRAKGYSDGAPTAPMPLRDPADATSGRGVGPPRSGATADVAPDVPSDRSDGVGGGAGPGASAPGTAAPSEPAGAGVIVPGGLDHFASVGTPPGGLDHFAGATVPVTTPAPTAVAEREPDETASPAGRIVPGGFDHFAAPSTAPARTEPVPEPAPAWDPAAEDRWPDDARPHRLALHRRGDGRSKRKLVPGAAADMLALARTHDEQLRHRSWKARLKSDADLVDALTAHLDGHASPVGAGVLHNMLARHTSSYELDKLNAHADAWLAEHGVVFAAEAVLASVTTVVNDGIRHQSTRKTVSRSWHGIELVGRVRAALATATDDEHASALDRVGAYLDRRSARAIAAVLMPTEADLVELMCQDVRTAHDEEQRAHLVLTAISTPEQLDLVKPAVPLWDVDHWNRTLPTLVTALGAEALPALVDWFRADGADPSLRASLAQHIAATPTDEALRFLVDLAPDRTTSGLLLAALRRQPGRATRVLADAVLAAPNQSAAGRPAARDLLEAHVLACPAAVAAVPLTAEARALVDGVAEGFADRVPEADPADLPRPLVDAPWERATAAAPPVVVRGLEPLGDATEKWLPGERDEWLAGIPDYFLPWEEVRDAVLTDEGNYLERESALLRGPVDQVRHLLRRLGPYGIYNAETGRALVARFGTDLLEVLPDLHVYPSVAAEVLLPLRSPWVAARMAESLGKRLYRPRAVAWFERHGVDGARPLVAAAVGPTGRARAAAESALRLVADRVGPEAVLAVAAEHGDKAHRAVRHLLEVDPVDVVPAKLPSLEGVDPAVLPQVLLRDRSRAVPLSAVPNLLLSLAIDRADSRYAGALLVRELCDPESLAAFGRALLSAWRLVGMPSEQAWVLTAQGAVGDDETVRVLSPLIRVWPGEGGHRRAVTGLDVLAQIGSDVALMHLDAISRKVKFKGLKASAREKLEQIAVDRDLSADQLADRLVPDFGLDADGTLVLDYGPRRFTVGFDEQLKPYVLDGDGNRRKELPKPGAKDDPELAPAAHRRFAALKKDVRTSAADQIVRLENAMVVGKRWTTAEFTTLLAGHPLLRHVVRRLVWLAERPAEDGAGRALSFRLAEDNSLADSADDPVLLPGDAEIRIAHPLLLAGELDAWAEVFADYELLQPFPQLGRPVHAPEDADGAVKALLEGEVETGRLLSLVRRGWERAEPQDAGVEPWMVKRLGPTRVLVLDLDPGLYVGAVSLISDKQRLAALTLERPASYYWNPQGKETPSLSTLDPVVLSELIADLESLRV
ncbi:DUF4132 domain-containing protein [Actinosynnema mirum]|uniref:WGR domain protein n=1 Tax=Actinosynnema mirum (strain ATCC 29888 / DSM 43827 / JCM 3225 / NBRC 14064 / NCIMB 13271 / NRRL B-12336 / IMRU 3971 / 101) TaxID=446462 RepID=C6WRU8_ACTMD|nr:DUF4132 domain-containing protein [Actinosynnema mirum]ACU36940.1 WGR domain protein [Actinosynnema mirum DSM 43827]